MKNYLRIVLAIAGIALFWLQAGAAIPAGYYYAADGKSGAALKTALHEIVSSMHTLSYGSGEGSTWEGFSRTDRRPDGSVWDMYSGEVRYFDGFKAVEGMHIEHSFPKSWWGAYENNAYRDLHHLFPADGSANSSKNNLPLGEVAGTPGFDNGYSKIGTNGFGADYADRCFEPADEYKGDFARAYFYVVTAYENLYDYWQSPMVDNNTYPVWNEWALELLLKWHLQDPPSEKELARNDSVYAIQGNRNPYIDFPALVEYVWGEHSDEPYTFPEETLPFLANPRRDQSIDMGVILTGDSKTESLEILGNNLDSPLSLSWKRGGIFQLSDDQLSPQVVHDGYEVEISCNNPSEGVYRDTLVISGGGIDRRYSIPVQLIVVPSFINTSATDVAADGATVHWIDYPSATDYRVSLWTGDTAAGDLIISAYIEGSGYNKAIELYNGTGAPVDLSAYSLRMAVNGGGNFYNDTPVGNIMLPNGGTYLLLNGQSTDETLRAKASQIIPGGETSPLNFNGNDAVALCRNGIIIDVVGAADEIAYWGQDKTLYRQTGVTHPAAVYNEHEWVSAPKDDFSQIGLFEMQFASQRNYLYTDKSVGLVQEYSFTGLRPLTRYTYQVTAVTPTGNVAAAYSMQFCTDSLDTPQLLDASNITDRSFCVNWEEVSAADGYEVHCFLQTGEQYTYVEGFDEVGSSGKPLPEGWDGDASGNYTSAASSGVSAPSVALKATGEKLITPHYPEGIVAISFMYRFASSGTGSYLVVEKESGGDWSVVDTLRYANTSKYYPSYTFPAEDQVAAVKITYAYKATGNIAIDDVSITYGSYTNETICREQVGKTASFVVPNLQSQTEYLYCLRAICQGVYSAWSPVQKVKTSQFSTISSIETHTPVVYALGSQIIVENLTGEEHIAVYNLSGQMLYNAMAGSQSRISIDARRGLYIIKVATPDKIFSTKVCL